MATILTHVKDPVLKENKTGIVYKIKCDCGAFYIGESGRSLGCRTKEHLQACKYAHFHKSPVAEHAWQGGHTILWNDTEVMDISQNLTERRVKEAIYINLAPQSMTMNRDRGMEISKLLIRSARSHLAK